MYLLFSDGVVTKLKKKKKNGEGLSSRSFMCYIKTLLPFYGSLFVIIHETFIKVINLEDQGSRVSIILK